MWKDFFYYSKSERRSILVLAGMGVLLLVSGTWIQSTKEIRVPHMDSICVDSFYVRAYQKMARMDSFPRYARTSKVTPILDYFDPNTADSSTFCRLGLPPFLARRIVNYRTKGGVFRKAEDFARIYGLTEKQYQQLKPFIVIDEALLQQKFVAHSKTSGTHVSDDKEAGETLWADGNEKRMSYRRDSGYVKYPEGTIIDLNLADTVELKKVPGIGSGLAKMIVAYRNRLGGYASVEQLQETGYVDVSLNKWFKIESEISRKLKVNRASLDQLRNHPYMNFYKAKVILEYRRKRGKIKGLSQLSMFQEFTEKDLRKLSPYLDFE